MSVLNTDERWFVMHPDRECHIRDAEPLEFVGEFASLGGHDPKRRRVLSWKVPRGTPFQVGRVMQIPYLAFADEEIADTDAVLRPILHETIMDAAKQHGIPLPPMARVN